MRSAREIAHVVRTGRRKAVAIVEEALQFAHESQSALNAFTHIDDEGALARAHTIDDLVERGMNPGPLAGVPVGLKDLIDQKGIPTTKGSSFPSEPSRESATVVNRLNASGAAIIGRTGLHEFAFGFTSENPWFGPVRNPWDIRNAAGGSSGGSAAAVSAGVVPVGIGTDTGGSVRVPAALCGVFGLKVTHGRIPLTGVYPLVASFDTVGPIARSVCDLASVFTALAGDDPSDPWSAPVEVGRVPAGVDPGSIRLGVVKQWFEPPIQDDLNEAITLFMAACSDAGFDVIEMDAESLRPIDEVTTASRAEVLEVHGDRFAKHPDRYGEDIRVRLSESQGVTARDVVVAQRWMTQARALVERYQQPKSTILIAPTVGIRSKRIGQDSVDVNGTDVFHRIPLSRFTAPINAIGCPSLSMPILGSGSPPVSVQFVGPPWSEPLLLGLGEWLERRGLVGFTPPPLWVGGT